MFSAYDSLNYIIIIVIIIILGYGYIIPPDMIPELIKHFKDATPIAMEDVYFTGETAKNIGYIRWSRHRNIANSTRTFLK